VLDRVSALAKFALAKAEEAAAQVAVMPAGPHAILSQTQEAVRRQANTLLEQLQKIGDAAPLETIAEMEHTVGLRLLDRNDARCFAAPRSPEKSQPARVHEAARLPHRNKAVAPSRAIMQM
jgi:hypothetical protein